MIQDYLKIHLEKIENKILARYRCKQLKRTDFTIISNNCWGGHVYRRYGLPYLSPTVGLYFFTDEYMKFIANLAENLNSDLRFISWTESRYKSLILEKKQESVPIGLLGGDIEIMFLHYQSAQEAYDKWNRRCQRVNLDNLIIKISQMNLCTIDHLMAFDRLDYKRKVAFVIPEYSSLLACGNPVYKYSNSERVLDDTTYYDRHIALDGFLNDFK